MSSIHDEDQGGRAARTQAPSVHHVFLVHLPADVGLQEHFGMWPDVLTCSILMKGVRFRFGGRAKWFVLFPPSNAVKF